MSAESEPWALSNRDSWDNMDGDGHGEAAVVHLLFMVIVDKQLLQPHLDPLLRVWLRVDASKRGRALASGRGGKGMVRFSGVAGAAEEQPAMQCHAMQCNVMYVLGC